MNKYLLNILLICFLASISLMQNKEIEIANFYESTLEYNYFVFDPSYATSFALNSYNPNNLEDISLFDVMIDGSLIGSVGSYTISPLINNFFNDTLSSTAFEHNRGDYAFNENVIFIDNIVDSTLKTIFVAQSKKYNGLESINSNSNPLQNYFFSLSKKYSSQNNFDLALNSTLMYHKEEAIIPLISAGSYNRNSEDYLGGITFDLDYDNKFNLSFNKSFQNGRGNFYNDLESDRFCNWSNFSTIYSFNSNVDFSFKYHNKLNSLENLLETNESVNIKSNTGEYLLSSNLKHKNISLNLSLYLSQSTFNDDFINNDLTLRSPKINFDFFYDYSKNLSLTIKRFSKSYITKFSQLNVSDINILRMDYKIHDLRVNFEPFYLTSFFNDMGDINQDRLQKEGEIFGLNSSVGYNKRNIIATIKSSLYSSNYDTPIDYYFNYSIFFAPKFYNKRFRPFVGLNGIYSKINNSNFIDFNSNQDSYFIWNSFDDISGQLLDKNVSLVNIELGLVLNQFKISYHFSNPLNHNTLFSFSKSYQTIPFFSKLQVTWQFFD